MNVNILATDLKFPEGPVITNQGNIYFVELLGSVITEYKRDTKILKRFNVGGAPNGMMVKNDDTLWFCDSKQNAIRSLDINTGQTETIVDNINGEPLAAPNDLIQDSEGNVLFTCPGGSQKNPIGYICVINKNMEVYVIAKDLYFPNGILFINEENNIIINETWQHRLVIGDWNKKSLKIDNIRSFYKIGGIAEPDGLALSKDNQIYAAVYNTSKVWVFDLKGHLQKQIQLPAKNPTNLCFDNIGDLGLLVTEAEKGLLLSIN